MTMLIPVRAEGDPHGCWSTWDGCLRHPTGRTTQSRHPRPMTLEGVLHMAPGGSCWTEHRTRPLPEPLQSIPGSRPCDRQSEPRFADAVLYQKIEPYGLSTSTMSCLLKTPGLCGTMARLGAGGSVRGSC